jgi:hypothetical protein
MPNRNLAFSKGVALAVVFLAGGAWAHARDSVCPYSGPFDVS